MVDQENTRWLDFGAQESLLRGTEDAPSRVMLLVELSSVAPPLAMTTFILIDHRCGQDIKYATVNSLVNGHALGSGL